MENNNRKEKKRKEQNRIEKKSKEQNRIEKKRKEKKRKEKKRKEKEGRLKLIHFNICIAKKAFPIKMQLQFGSQSCY